MHWISDIVFDFCKLLLSRAMSLQLGEYLDWFFFQTSNLTFIASEIKILFFTVKLLGAEQVYIFVNSWVIYFK